MEEFANNVGASRRILARARVEVKGEWKVFLESVLLESRAGNYRAAVRLADEALVLHAGTGRLWAILVLICHRLEGLMPVAKRNRVRMKDSERAGNGDKKRGKERDKEGNRGAVERVHESECLGVTSDAVDTPSLSSKLEGSMTGGEDSPISTFDNPNSGTKVGTGERDHEEQEYASDDDAAYPIPSKLAVLLRAIQEVPKSGEVWCEGARCHMNPLHIASFDLSSAQKFLSFAVQFTPQYGDTFMELLRLEMILQVILPRVLNVLGVSIVSFFRRFLAHDVDADCVCVLNDYGWLQSVCVPDDVTHTCVMGTPGSVEERERRQRVISDLDTMDLDFGRCVDAYKSVLIKNLSRRLVHHHTCMHESILC